MLIVWVHTQREEPKPPNYLPVSKSITPKLTYKIKFSGQQKKIWPFPNFILYSGAIISFIGWKEFQCFCFPFFFNFTLGLKTLCNDFMLSPV